MTRVKNFILVILVFTFSSCCKTMFEQSASDECKQYYARINKDWKKKDGFYKIKGNPPFLKEAKYQKMYFDEICLKNLKKRDTRKLFGKPNLIEKKNGFKIETYCLNEDCSHKFLITFDKDCKVIYALLNPTAISKD